MEKLKAMGLINEKPLALENLELKYRMAAAAGRLGSLKNAAKNLEHYLDGQGKTITISREEARGFKTFAEQEEIIQRYYREITFSNKIDPKQLSQLKDGETIQVEDNFEAATKRFVSKKQDGLDFDLAFGTTDINSEGVLNVTKQGDRAIIDGEVTFSYQDPYDFPADSENFWDKEMIRLEEGGHAKTYMIEGEWRQRVHGAADIVDGKLKSIQLQWKDQ